MTYRRNLTARTIEDVNRQESDEFLPVFMTISHKSLNKPIRVVTNSEDIILGGNRFIGFLFEINLLSDSEGMSSARLQVQNVDKRIANAILDTVDPPRIMVEIIAIRHFNEDVIPHTEKEPNPPREYKAANLDLVDVTGNEQYLSGTLRSWDYRQEVWPYLRADHVHFPGLYW